MSEVPLVAAPQTLSVSLAGTVYSLRMSWCKFSQCWVGEIADSSGNPLLQGFPLVTGTNLLGQYAYKGIGGALVVASDGDPDAVPTFTNLGRQGHLYFVTQP